MHQEVQHQSPSIWETVLGDSAPQAYVPAGELVFRAGESPTLALIRAGLVRVFISTEGGRQLTIRYARPGDLIGLAPLLVHTIFEAIEEIHRQGTPVLLVEQNANAALKHSNRAYVLETGTVLLEGTSAEVAANPKVKEAYLGE